MANDKLYHKRKARERKDALRKASTRKAKRRILIVCEGQTEETYFKFYIDKEDDLLAHVTSDCGTSPMCVVTCAHELATRDGDFDDVFAVFDGDTADIANFDLALVSTKKHEENGIPIKAIPSTPCFEYWLLLHFTFSRRPYIGTKNAKSAGTQILTELRSFTGMESYNKGTDLNFPAFVGKLDTAITNAERAVQQAKESEERNPSTSVHCVIKNIQGKKP